MRSVSSHPPLVLYFVLIVLLLCSVTMFSLFIPSAGLVDAALGDQFRFPGVVKKTVMFGPRNHNIPWMCLGGTRPGLALSTTGVCWGEEWGMHGATELRVVCGQILIVSDLGNM